MKERNANGAYIAELFLVEIAYDCASWKSSNFWFIRENFCPRTFFTLRRVSHFIRVWSLDGLAARPSDVQFEDPFMLSSHFRQRCAISHSYGIIRQWLACEAQSGKGSRTGSNCHSHSTDELQVTDNTYALIRKPNFPRSSSVRNGPSFIFHYVIPIVAGTRIG